MGPMHRDVALLLERDPGFVCAYCAVPLALALTDSMTSQEAWEAAGWELALLPDGEGVWQVTDERRLAHRDHIVPRSKGGSDDIDNLVLSCEVCNNAKKARSVLLFLAIRAGCPRYKKVA